MLVVRAYSNTVPVEQGVEGIDRLQLEVGVQKCSSSFLVHLTHSP